MSNKIALCQVQALDHSSVKKVAHPTQAGLELIVVKTDQEYFAYHNICPHFSVQLDNARGEFFTYENQWIMCAHHSAMFDIRSGLCVEGPCKASHLTAVPIAIEAGQIVLKDCSH